VAKNASLAGAIHDLQARLGSIRIAVTAVAGLDLDEETRREMLTSAGEESARASAELSGVSALAQSLLDASLPEDCDLGGALQAAADSARLAGLDVEITGADGVVISARKARLELALPALLRLVGGAGKRVRVEVADNTITLTGDDTEPVAPVTGYLVNELDASLAFRFGASA